jgi:hypothetical protein
VVGTGRREVFRCHAHCLHRLDLRPARLHPCRVLIRADGNMHGDIAEVRQTIVDIGATKTKPNCSNSAGSSGTAVKKVSGSPAYPCRATTSGAPASAS